MALAETARLIASLELRDQFSGNASRINQSLAGMERGVARAGGQMSGLGRLSAGAGAAMGTFRSRLGQVGGALGPLTGPLGLLGLAAGLTKTVTASRDFDTAMRRIVGLTDVGAEEIGGIREAILSLAGDVGKAPQELADAFYFLASAGLDGKEALDVLTTSARASATGLGATQDVAKTLGAVINAYGHQNISAAEAADTLTAAVKDGTAEASDFASVLQYVIPTAAAMKVPFDQATAAIAAMTLGGTSAETAATNLNNVLSSLLKPTAEATETLKEMGTSTADLRQEIKEKGLLVTLEDLRDRFGGNEAAMAKVFGNIRSLRGVMGLLNLDADQLAQVFGDTASATGDLNRAFDETEGPGRKMNRALAALQVTAINLGDQWLPLIADGLANVGEWLNTHQQDIINFGRNAADAVKGIAGVVGSVVGGLSKVWDAVPDPVKDILVKGLLADRTVKFLFGFSPIRLATDTIAGLLGKLAANKLVPQLIEVAHPIPVLVVNEGFGGIGGRTGGGTPIVGGGRGLLGGLARATIFGAVALGAAEGLHLVADAIDSGNEQRKRDFEASGGGFFGLDPFGQRRPPPGAATPLGQFNPANAGGVPVKVTNRADVFDADAYREAKAARLAGEKVAFTLEQRLRRDPSFHESINSPREFIRLLRRTSEFGERGTGTTIEHGPTTGQDPTGRAFVALVRRLDDKTLQSVQVQGEIRRHILAAKELLGTGNRREDRQLQQTIDALRRLLRTGDASNRNERDGNRRLADLKASQTKMNAVLGEISGDTAATARSTGTIAAQGPPNVTVYTNVSTAVSVSDVIRDVVTSSYATKMTRDGVPIG